MSVQARHEKCTHGRGRLEEVQCQIQVGGIPSFPGQFQSIGTQTPQTNVVALRGVTQLPHKTEKAPMREESEEQTSVNFGAPSKESVLLLWVAPPVLADMGPSVALRETNGGLDRVHSMR